MTSTLQCPNCQADSPRIRYLIEEPYKILRCRKCHLMWLHPKPSQEELHEVYNENYFRNNLFFDNKNTTLYGYSDYSSERFNKQSQYRVIVRNALSYLSQKAELQYEWLDFGCGFGYLMDTAYDFKFRVSGIEFNEHAIEELKKRYNYRVALNKGDFSFFDDELFDVISMTDVIEHLDDPYEHIRQFHKRLKNKGILIITTMDSESVTSLILGKRLEDFRRIREHLFFFSRQTIRELLEQNGFKVLHISSIGHTFDLGMLVERVRLISPFLALLMQFFIRLGRLDNRSIYFDPRTKMIVYAQKIQS